jgi:A/G-specific adenine glycosylase
VSSVAAAEEQEVLRLWEGLGYYRRARLLHAAAQQIEQQYGGRLPDDIADLQQLPGIGRYTAGAISSIAFGRRAPILEANTVRLLCRLTGYREDPAKSAGQKFLWQTAEAIMPQKDVAQFNQALMELGALVCTPLEPKCDVCPVAELCAAQERGLQADIPMSKERQVYTPLHEAAVVVRKNGHVLLRQCTATERWAGLWDFPRFGIESEGPLFARAELVEKVRAMTGITSQPPSLITTIRHDVTRYRITLDCYAAEYDIGRVRSDKEKPIRWARLSELSDYPLSTTGRKIARLLFDNASLCGT